MGSETVRGYDVSHWEPDLSVHAHQKALGAKFCMIKSSEGANVIDHLFKAHWAEAKKQGMMTGAYNFFHPSQDPQAQAHNFENMVGQLSSGDFGPIIDWEQNDGQPAVKDAEAGLAFLLAVEKFTGRLPIIYGGPYFLQALGLDSRFTRFTNWIAHYTTKCPLCPPPWTAINFWQYSGSPLDLNLFNGNLAALQKLAGL